MGDAEYPCPECGKALMESLYTNPETGTDERTFQCSAFDCYSRFQADEIIPAPPMTQERATVEQDALRERVICSMEDDPFMDDIRVQGTSGHSARLEHYTDIALATAGVDDLHARVAMLEGALRDLCDLDDRCGWHSKQLDAARAALEGKGEG